MIRPRPAPLNLLLCATVLLGCSKGPPAPAPAPPPSPLEELVIQKVSADLSRPEPGAVYWQGVQQGIVTLTAQPMITPRPEKTTTGSVLVQALHDGAHVAFRLQWKDTEKSEAGRLGQFSDALALEFPMKDGDPPPVMMGAKGDPVHLFHWRAQYQRDKEQGKPEMKTLYPNGSIDMYPMDFKEARGGTTEDKEKFSPGVAQGNPQSFPKEGVDEIIAEGFSTSAVQQGHGSKAAGEWKEGAWTLVIVRPLAIEGGSSLKPGRPSNIAFAVWQGGKAEVGSRKCVTMSWTPVKVQ